MRLGQHGFELVVVCGDVKWQRTTFLRHMLMLERLAQLLDIVPHTRYTALKRILGARVQTNTVHSIGRIRGSTLRQARADHLRPRPALGTQLLRQVILDATRQTRAAVRQTRVQLHGTRTGSGEVESIVRGQNATTANQRHTSLGACVHDLEGMQGQWLDGRTGQTARLVHMLVRKQAGWARDGRVAHNNAIRLGGTRRIGHILQLSIGQVRRDFDQQRQRAVRRDTVASLDHVAEHALEHAAALQTAQAWGVGTADVDHEHIRIRSQCLHSLDIVDHRVFPRCLVLAEVDAQQTVLFQTARHLRIVKQRRTNVGILGKELCFCEVLRIGRRRTDRRNQALASRQHTLHPAVQAHVQALTHRLMTVRVEAHAIDHRTIERQTEHARLRVARLRLGRHTADLDDAKS